MPAFMNLKANGETLFITSCRDELEEFLDENEEICRRHGYELTLNGRPIHKLEHPFHPYENDLSGDGQSQWDNEWSY